MLKFFCFIAYQDEVDIKSHSTEEVESSSSKDRGFSDEMHFTSSHHSLLSSKLLLFYWITFQFTICSETCCEQCLGNGSWTKKNVCFIGLNCKIIIIIIIMMMMMMMIMIMLIIIINYLPP